MPRPDRADALSDDACLTSVCLTSVAYIGPKSRTEAVGRQHWQLAGGGAYCGGLPYSLLEWQEIIA